MSKETKKPVVNGAPREVKVVARPTPKAEVKAATKPTFKATAKPVPKPAALKIKVGQEVKVRNTRNGNVTVGRFVGRTQVPGAAGNWLKVNIAAKGKPAEFKLARAGQVSI